jgi:hypothetical protein
MTGGSMGPAREITIGGDLTVPRLGTNAACALYC